MKMDAKFIWFEQWNEVQISSGGWATMWILARSILPLPPKATYPGSRFGISLHRVSQVSLNYRSQNKVDILQSL